MPQVVGSDLPVKVPLGAVRRPSLCADSRLALALDVALVSQIVAIRVGGIKHVVEVRGVM
jgi:hypothetical protein